VSTNTSGRVPFWLLAPGFWLLLSAGSGCSGTIHPPANPVNPTTVYLADYGRHSSLVLPAQDGKYVEWAFGDWNWFALGHTKWNDAISAIVWSPQATLGRRDIPPQPDDESLRRLVEANRIVKFDVSSDRAAALNNRLQRRFDNDDGTVLHSDYAHLDMVKDPEHYWALNNCNHVTMHWLRELGCRVDGFGILSNFKLAK